MKKGETPAQDKIDKKTFEGLCAIQCTRNEVCSFFGIEDDTLNSWCKKNYNGKTFSAIFEEKKGIGKISLRRTMFRQAEKNPTMAIWLSKQHLGMKDNVEVDHNINNGILDELLGAIKNHKTEN